MNGTTTATKLSLLLVLTFAVCASPLHANPGVPPGALVPSAGELAPSDREATDAYRSGEYATAYELWTSTLADRSIQGPERGRLLYNLGNAAFRAGREYEAVGWYTAALRYLPRDADLWANLEFARSEAGLEPADRGDLAATVERLLSALTLAESEWAVLGALFVWALLLACEALYGGRTFGRLAWGGLALVTISLLPWVYNLREASAARVLVVDDRATPVLSEPRDGAAQVAKARSGAVIERLDALPDWVRVQAEDGTAGWVPRAVVFELRR